PCRAKVQPLHPRRSYFAPAETHGLPWAWVEAPGTAPGSDRLIALTIYRHSRPSSAPRNIGGQFPSEKTAHSGIGSIAGVSDPAGENRDGVPASASSPLPRDDRRPMLEKLESP